MSHISQQEVKEMEILKHSLTETQKLMAKMRVIYSETVMGSVKVIEKKKAIVTGFLKVTERATH